MSKAATSPTARLLQTSRLFSLPRPLPSPSLEGVTSSGLYRASDSATTPYPTHQAITTPKSSLHRGDFGLKRPLPSKTTRNTSTPHVRVTAQDTFEHVTEFASAADHTQSREKWLEMGVPMIVQSESKLGRQSHESVFEDHLDITDPENMQEHTHPGGGMNGMGGISSKAKQRWKYGGPWTAGMMEGEFRPWVKRNAAAKRKEWREFLWTEHLKQERERRMRDAKRKAEEARQVFPGESLSTETVVIEEDVAAESGAAKEQRLDKIEKKLRDDHITGGLSSRLSRLITAFLDLPGSSGTSQPGFNPAETLAFQSALNDILSGKGPPTTHLSAGLSHLRTNAIMPNHPLYGPQKYRAPVQSRVVRPRYTTSGMNEPSARLGVGGFVAADPVSSTSPEQKGGKRREEDEMAARLDVDLPHGNKLWVHPESASIDERGLVKLNVSRADPEALAVKQGNVDYFHELKRASMAKPSRQIGSRGGQGVNRIPPRTAARSGLRGFDDEVGSEAQGMSEQRATDWMRQMADKVNERSGRS